ncbi:MAG: 2-C-methyl-D-erythritol 4-phosphate cytidylyltransferase [Acidimicrobiia bacterium]|nr:2-C-methyl-D-erythritol 4-phosphate cytidylyltransferase [Acidimicrobiia bacterium]
MSVTQCVGRDNISVWTVLVAAGEGRRFGAPKQLQPLAGRRVIDWALEAAAAASHGVVVVAAADQVQTLRDGPAALTASADPVAAPPSAGSQGGTTVVVTTGGSTRSESVRAGIAEVPEDTEVIVIHDAARPLAGGALFTAVTAAVVSGADGAVPAIPVTDTIRHTENGSLDRSQLRAVQTPQAFRADLLRRAHASGDEATDDASLVEAAGGKVRLVAGEPDNLKITTPGDLHVAESLLVARAPDRPAGVPLVGIGFDVHRFSDDPQRDLVLGGVLFEGERGLDGHSDADAVAHACCDAILGVAGLGDIGTLFPDDDERWRGADSLALLAEAAAQVRGAGRRIGNIDCTVVAERPKLAPRRAEMQARLSEAAGAPVTVGGNRAESLGALGRGEGIACWAVAVLF